MAFLPRNFRTGKPRSPHNHRLGHKMERRRSQERLSTMLFVSRIRLRKMISKFIPRCARLLRYRREHGGSNDCRCLIYVNSMIPIATPMILSSWLSLLKRQERIILSVDGGTQILRRPGQYKYGRWRRRFAEKLSAQRQE